MPRASAGAPLSFDASPHRRPVRHRVVSVCRPRLMFRCFESRGLRGSPTWSPTRVARVSVVCRPFAHMVIAAVCASRSAGSRLHATRAPTSSFLVLRPRYSRHRSSFVLLGLVCLHLLRGTSACGSPPVMSRGALHSARPPRFVTSACTFPCALPHNPAALWPPSVCSSTYQPSRHATHPFLHRHIATTHAWHPCAHSKPKLEAYERRPTGRRSKARFHGSIPMPRPTTTSAPVRNCLPERC